MIETEIIRGQMETIRLQDNLIQHYTETIRKSNLLIKDLRKDVEKLKDAAKLANGCFEKEQDRRFTANEVIVRLISDKEKMEIELESWKALAVNMEIRANKAEQK